MQVISHVYIIPKICNYIITVIIAIIVATDIIDIVIICFVIFVTAILLLLSILSNTITMLWLFLLLLLIIIIINITIIFTILCISVLLLIHVLWCTWRISVLESVIWKNIIAYRNIYKYIVVNFVQLYFYIMFVLSYRQCFHEELHKKKKKNHTLRCTN